MKHKEKNDHGSGLLMRGRHLPKKSYREMQWEERFTQLKRYKKKNGHCNVPQQATDRPRDEQILGTWCARQRREYRKKTLPDEYRRKLQGIGFEFNPLDALWERAYKSLTQFHKKCGHCNVPSTWEDKKGFRLGIWVVDVRGQEIRLTEQRKQRLNRLGFIWNLNEYIWEGYYQQLVDFKKHYGHCNVSEQSRHYGELGAWVGRMRMIKRQSRRQKATKEQLQRLEALGVDWEPRDHLWEKNYQALVSFKKKHGHCYLPLIRKEDQTLGNWVAAQRTKRKSLPAGRVRLLNKIGFEWDGTKAYRQYNNMLSQDWEKNFDELLAYKKAHGHCHVPLEKNLGGVLGLWVKLQRQGRKRGILTRGQIRRLDAVEFEWDGRTAFYLRNNLQQKKAIAHRKLLKITKTWQQHWKENFTKLVSYKKVHGHCYVAMQDINYPGLGSWVATQRRNRDALPTKARHQLEKLGFEWDGKKAYRQRNGFPEVGEWEENFRALVQFHKKYGHSHVPIREELFRGLGRWMDIQRRDRRILSVEQVGRLESLDFEWNNRMAFRLRKELQRNNPKAYRLQKDIARAKLVTSTNLVKTRKKKQ